jgi:hypothetical protein
MYLLPFFGDDIELARGLKPCNSRCRQGQSERVQRSRDFGIGEHRLAGRAFQEQACDPVTEPEGETSELGRRFRFLLFIGQSPSFF